MISSAEPAISNILEIPLGLLSRGIPLARRVRALSRVWILLKLRALALRIVVMASASVLALILSSTTAITVCIAIVSFPVKRIGAAASAAAPCHWVLAVGACLNRNRTHYEQAGDDEDDFCG